MEKQPWTPKYQQSVVTGLERRDELLNNGNCDNLRDTTEINDNSCENKCDKNHVKDDLEAAVGEKAKIKIQSILDQVNTLVPIEKLLLYLKLPTENANHIDPLRQPLNPLGSRTEISQTIMWIKTHLEEDPEISLQKKGVYEEYVQFCEPNNIKPLSTADFGKVMKQVYPKVRPRRLGTRGNSQYCYSGLRKRIKLSSPILPDLGDKPMSTEPACNQTDLYSAAWIIVKEWSENKLGSQFQSLHNLAFYLVKNLSVGLGSTSALLITSAVQSQLKGDMSSSVISSRHKETIRKIQQKCEGRDQKRKLQTPQLKTEQKSRSKKPKVQLQTSTSSSTSPIAVSEIKTSPSQGLQPVCDKSLDFTNLQTLPDFSSFQRPTSDKASDKHCDVTVKDTDGYGNFNTAEVTPTAKIPIPRLTTKQSPVLSPKRTKNFKYKHIQPKPEQCDIASYNPQPTLSAGDSRSQEAVAASKSKKVRKKESNNGIASLDEDHPAVHFTRERLISIGSVSKDALDDYLGTSNSQENEEELMKYFEHENVNNNQEQDVTKKQKLSQLRLLLEQNCVTFPQEVQDSNKLADSVVGSNSSAFIKTRSKNSLFISNSLERPNITALPQAQSNVSNARRRVSFDTHVHEDNVPPSPNTRRKNFSFTPISPGPHSPTGRQSKCSSTNASPFVSPRNTPVPRARGNSHPYPGNQHTNSLSTRKQMSAGKKIKHELDLNVDGNNVKELFKNHVNMPMSAPPSPKTNLLQNILNSNQKYTYTPNYNPAVIRTVNLVDQLSPEVTHLLSSNIQQATLEPALRSQSVPLNVVPTSCFTHFSFNLSNNNQDSVQNDFNDMDTFSEGENINVNKIIDTIDQTNLGTLLDDGNLQIGHNEFCNVDAVIDINNDINMPIETESFCATSNIQYEKCTNVRSTPAEVLPNLRTVARSQTIDIDNITYMKCNPSRSVPSTPIPYSKTQIESLKIDVNHYSRSYPSTPLANETFKYNQTQDYLLNGQPIKEKVLDDSNDINLLNIVNKSDMYENMFHVANLGTLIADNKNNFNFDGQIAENSFGAKQNVDPALNQECVIENEYFKGVPDMNGT